MKTIRWVAAAAAAAGLCGIAFAMQQGRTGAGEIEASSTLTLNEDEDEVTVTYHTLRFGPQTVASMRSNAQRAQQWADRIPQMAASELESDVDLKFGDTVLEAGEYGVSFLATGEGWELHLIDQDQKKHAFPLEVHESPVNFDYLTFNLLSVGSDQIRVLFGYGPQVATIDAAVVSDDDADDMGDEDGG